MTHSGHTCQKKARARLRDPTPWRKRVYTTKSSSPFYAHSCYGHFLSQSYAWLPDGYRKIFRAYVFGPSGLKDYGSATLRCKI